MRTRIVPLSIVVATVIALASQSVVNLSAQHPGQFQGRGWVMAYAGGASPTGALGRIADVVSPPIAVEAAEVFTDISDIAIGSNRTLIVRREGSLWTMGGGVETLTQIPGVVDIYQVAAGGASNFAIDTAGVLWMWSNGLPVESPFIDAAAVDANTNIAVVARWDGSLWRFDHAADSAPVAVSTPPDFIAVDVAVGESIARSIENVSRPRTIRHHRSSRA